MAGFTPVPEVGLSVLGLRWRMGTRAQIEQLVAQATAKVPDANARIDALEKAGPPVLVALMILRMRLTF